MLAVVVVGIRQKQPHSQLQASPAGKNARIVVPPAAHLEWPHPSLCCAAGIHPPWAPFDSVHG